MGFGDSLSGAVHFSPCRQAIHAPSDAIKKVEPELHNRPVFRDSTADIFSDGLSTLGVRTHIKLDGSWVKSLPQVNHTHERESRIGSSQDRNWCSARFFGKEGAKVVLRFYPYGKN